MSVLPCFTKKLAQSTLVLHGQIEGQAGQTHNIDSHVSGKYLLIASQSRYAD